MLQNLECLYGRITDQAAISYDKPCWKVGSQSWRKCKLYVPTIIAGDKQNLNNHRIDINLDMTVNCRSSKILEFELKRIKGKK